MRVHRLAVSRLLPVLVAGLVLGGCGSGSSVTNAGATPASNGGGGSSPASTTSAAAASTPAASTPVVSSDDFCQKIVAEKTALTSNELPKLLGSGTPDGWKKYLAATAALNDTLYNAAPDEIKGAVDQLRQVNVKLTAILAAAGYDITKVKSTEIIAAIRTPAYTKASAEFASYVKTHCSIDLTKP